MRLNAEARLRAVAAAMDYPDIAMMEEQQAVEAAADLAKAAEDLLEDFRSDDPFRELKNPRLIALSTALDKVSDV